MQWPEASCRSSTNPGKSANRTCTRYLTLSTKVSFLEKKLQHLSAKTSEFSGASGHAVSRATDGPKRVPKLHAVVRSTHTKFAPSARRRLQRLPIQSRAHLRQPLPVLLVALLRQQLLALLILILPARGLTCLHQLSAAPQLLAPQGPSQRFTLLGPYTAGLKGSLPPFSSRSSSLLPCHASLPCLDLPRVLQMTPQRPLPSHRLSLQSAISRVTPGPSATTQAVFTTKAPTTSDANASYAHSACLNKSFKAPLTSALPSSPRTLRPQVTSLTAVPHAMSSLTLVASAISPPARLLPWSVSTANLARSLVMAQSVGFETYYTPLQRSRPFALSARCSTLARTTFSSTVLLPSSLQRLLPLLVQSESPRARKMACTISFAALFPLRLFVPYSQSRSKLNENASISYIEHSAMPPLVVCVRS